LQDVNETGPALVVVHRPEDTARLDREEAHPELAAGHALDLGTEVERRQQLRRDASSLGGCLILAQGEPSSSRPTSFKRGATV
jgi:hypothetical protein